MDGPILPPPLTFPTLTPLLFLWPLFLTSTSHLYERTCSLLCPSFLLCFFIGPRLHLAPHPPHHTHPSPGQADAIGASSLRDPVPYLSLVCLLFLTPPSVPLWIPRPKSQCWLGKSHLSPTQLKTLQSALAIGLPREG